MFDANDVRALLDAHLQTVAGLPDLVTENTRYTPQDTTWTRSTLLPARSITPVLGQRVQLQGTYQVDVIVPAGTDTTASGPLCKAIMSAFFPGTTVTDGTNVVTINNITQQVSMVDDQMNYMVPLQIEWFVLTGL